MCFIPGYIETKMINNLKSFLCITADVCAKAALKCMGKSDTAYGHPIYIFTSMLLNFISAFKCFDKV